MTEDQIERTVERRMNRLDYLFIGEQQMTQEEYDSEVAKLNAWANAEYAKVRP